MLNRKTKLIHFLPPQHAPENQRHDEKSKVKSYDFYGWTKKHGEELTKFYAERNKLKILNISLQMQLDEVKLISTTWNYYNST